MDNKALLEAIEAMIDAKLNPIKEDLEILKEESAITRAGVNTLLDWAEQAQIEVKIPLYRKAE